MFFKNSQVSHKYLLITALLLASLLASCAAKPTLPPPPPPKKITGIPGAKIADIREMPQELVHYIKRGQENKLVINRGQATALASMYRERYYQAWNQERPVVPRGQIQKIMRPFARSAGYSISGGPHDSSVAASAMNNANLGTYPNAGYPGVILAPTNMRIIPTKIQRLATLEKAINKEPFDTLQTTALHPGAPIYISHYTRDNSFAYIDSPLASGWVPAEDLSRVDEEFMNAYRTSDLAVVIKDKLRISAANIDADIGTALPKASSSGASGISVLVPTRAQGGFAKAVQASLTSDDAVTMPFAATPANMAKVGQRVYAQPYGWGGQDRLRDCSAMTRDLLAPFGVWLPRNSGAQKNVGQIIQLAHLPNAEKEAAILRHGEPFFTLAWLPGHIMLYVGEWEGRPAFFHNMWGVRTGTDGSGRMVVGRAVVTSLTPGKELPEVEPIYLIVNRVNSINSFN